MVTPLAMALHLVCPARAGMIRPVGREPSPTGGLPRTRGDDPVLDGTGAAPGEFAPHARG